MNSNITNFPRQFVYFEKQSNDRLCGVHCLNSLLQGPFFDPFSLAEIAQTLDQLEMDLYKEDINSVNMKAIGNVDDDGNYNVQVLSEALKLQGAEIVSVKQSECDKILSESLDEIEAFIFNSSTHWFAIRKIDNIWFNLNSTNPGPGPQIISDFYLSAFIKGTEELGYTNVLVKNVPPMKELSSNFYQNLASYQKLVKFEDIVKSKPKNINMGDSDDQALEKALELSKQDLNKDFEYNKFGEESEFSDLKDFEKNIILDDELQMVLDLSMNEYVDQLNKIIPEEPDFVTPHIEVTFDLIHQGSKKVQIRRFNPNDKICDLKNFAKAQLRTYGDIKFTGKTNNKIYMNDDQTLIQAGLSPKTSLIAQFKE